MKTGTSKIIVDFDKEFIPTLDDWKIAITREGIKSRLKKLIHEDLNKLDKIN